MLSEQDREFFRQIGAEPYEPPEAPPVAEGFVALGPPTVSYCRSLPYHRNIRCTVPLIRRERDPDAGR